MFEFDEIGGLISARQNRVCNVKSVAN